MTDKILLGETGLTRWRLLRAVNVAFIALFIFRAGRKRKQNKNRDSVKPGIEGG